MSVELLSKTVPKKGKKRQSMRIGCEDKRLYRNDLFNKCTLEITSENESLESE